MDKYLFALFVSASFLFTGCKKLPDGGSPEPEPPEWPTEVGLLTFAPAFPTDANDVTIRFDSNKGNKELQGFSGDVYAHIGVITNTSSSPSDWKYVKTDWGENISANRLVRTSSGIYELKLNPRDYFGVPANERITHIALVFRNADGSRVGRNVDGSDIYMPVFDESLLNVRFVNPEMQPTYELQPAAVEWSVGQTLELEGLSSKRANLTLLVNGVEAGSVNAAGIKVSYTFENSGTYTFTVRSDVDGQTAEQRFAILVAGEPEVAEIPLGAASNGVTFGNDGTTAIFVLTAPEKNSVYLIGDFNDWQLTTAGFMKRTPDGKRWWAQLDNLDPNAEYAYQFVVDGNLRIADPYAELVLDPDHDRYIPGATFPGLKSYPEGRTTGIVSVTKGRETPYSWSNAPMNRPHKHDLVIYELLLRDFLQTNNYQTLTDTLNYLSNLGVNAVQLLPINEFEGNSSWGYNPSFYFAPDKYYGAKNNLKRFIDACHGRGIAVILDVVLNHSFGQSPMVQLYFQGGRPATSSPWFNVEPTHPFNVGFDFNHESEYTKAFTKDVLQFWMEEYHVDGFRFDLSKGFTQKNSGTSEGAVGAWSAYDASRVAIWKDYNNFIRNIDPNFYVILEHFADDEEERELAREGMMLWNNLNHTFNEATMGWLDNSNFSRLFHAEHGFDEPNLISYMESHDEERIMYKNLQYGNGSGSYDIKSLTTALNRVELAAAFLFAAPGPKMLWQFGELGYEVPIDENGRTGEKPIRWEYNSGERRALYRAFSRFINYKTKNEIFRIGQSEYELSGAIKYILLTHGTQQVLVVGNFDVTAHTANITSFAGGMWYDNGTSNPVNLSAGYGRSLAPGEYHIYSKTRLNR